MCLFVLVCVYVCVLHLVYLLPLLFAFRLFSSVLFGQLAAEFCLPVSRGECVCALCVLCVCVCAWVVSVHLELCCSACYVLRVCVRGCLCVCLCFALLLCVASFLFGCAPGANSALCGCNTHTHTIRDASYICVCVCACTLCRCCWGTNVASNMHNDFCCSLTRCLICVRYMWQSRHTDTGNTHTHRHIQVYTGTRWHTLAHTHCHTLSYRYQVGNFKPLRAAPWLSRKLFIKMPEVNTQ